MIESGNRSVLDSNYTSLLRAQTELQRPQRCTSGADHQWSLLAAHPGDPLTARRKELPVRDGVEAFLTRYAKEK